jgi:preprotein translocase subunit Sec61beta
VNSGLVLLVLGGFLLGGAYSVWSVDEDAPTRTTPQLVVAATLLLAALLATAAGILRFV